MRNTKRLLGRNVVKFAKKLKRETSLLEPFTHISDEPYPCGNTQSPNPMKYFDKWGKISKYEEICNFLSAFAKGLKLKLY